MRLRSTTVAFAGVALLTLVLAAACGSSNSSPTAPTQPTGGGGGGTGTTTITISNFSFSPSSITVTAGSSVVWKNNDSTSHTATADNGSFNTGIIAPGASSNAITMSTPGTFTYHCQIHPFMTATITVQ